MSLSFLKEKQPKENQRKDLIKGPLPLQSSDSGSLLFEMKPGGDSPAFDVKF
ncbi:MAG: hypothetical protein SPK25_02010 [Eubacteriales bacterium]|nr:hypothetical protein [Eubacteriales bacterium]MDY5800941.1 hypothetical protein [Eubacteriales bacterium]